MSQGYDGASVDCTKSVEHAANCFARLESLYVFVSSTKAHTLFVQKHYKLRPTEPKLQLKRLSDTRWICKYDAVDTMCCRFDAVVATLDEIANGDDHGKSVEARGLLLQVNSFSFLLLLISFYWVLSVYTKKLSDVLQSQQCNLGKAADTVSATIETLEEFRLVSFWDHLFEYAQQVGERFGIQVTSLQQKRTTRLPNRFEHSFVLEPTGWRECLSTSNEYKVNIYLPILDSFLGELKERFGSRNMEIMNAIQAWSPESNQFFGSYHLSLTMEAKLAKRTLASGDKSKEMKTVSDVLLELQPLKEAFPTLVKPLQIALTICVSSAQCERRFSVMKLSN